MSTPLEKIIRPYQLEQLAMQRRLPDTQQGGPEYVKLKIGRGGSGKSFNGSASSTVTVYCEAAQNEIFR